MPDGSPLPRDASTAAETSAVRTFQRLLGKSQKVRSNIRVRAAREFTDGYVEILDGGQNVTGRLEAQVRVLPKDARRRLKIRCSTNLIAYAETMTYDPVLLVAVDVESARAYWLNVTALSRISSARNVDTITVAFDPRVALTGFDNQYLERWRALIEEQRTKLLGYGSLNESYRLLASRPNPLVGFASSDFKEIHAFLDETNLLLDEKFSVIKGYVYPHAWKLGVAYERYDQASVSYLLYPLRNDQNLVQIKKIDSTLMRRVKALNPLAQAYTSENPIKASPRSHAHRMVKSLVLPLVGHKNLSMTASELLAREFVVAFTDRFVVEMGQEGMDAYSLGAVKFGFYAYLPFWVDSVLRFLERRSGSDRAFVRSLRAKPNFDPSTLKRMLSQDERRSIKDIVERRLAEPNPSPQVRVDSHDLSFKLMHDCLEALSEQGIDGLPRLYREQDPSRFSMRLGVKWNTLSPEDVEHNVRVLFEDLPRAYQEVAAKIVPQIADEIPVFGEASRIIVILDIRDDYKSSTDIPRYRLVRLQSEVSESLNIQVYRKGAEPEDLYSQDHTNGVQLDGRRYAVLGSTDGIPEFAYDKLPMSQLVYDFLADNLRHYFQHLEQLKH